MVGNKPTLDRLRAEVTQWKADCESLETQHRSAGDCDAAEYQRGGKEGFQRVLKDVFDCWSTSTLGAITSAVMQWKTNCENYEKQHRTEGNIGGAEYHRGGKEAFQRALNSILLLRYD